MAGSGANRSQVTSVIQAAAHWWFTALLIQTIEPDWSYQLHIEPLNTLCSDTISLLRWLFHWAPDKKVRPHVTKWWNYKNEFLVVKVKYYQSKWKVYMFREDKMKKPRQKNKLFTNIVRGELWNLLVSEGNLLKGSLRLNLTIKSQSQLLCSG